MNIWIKKQNEKEYITTIKDAKEDLDKGLIILDKTLVWHEGMKEWAPLSSILPPAVPEIISTPPPIPKSNNIYKNTLNIKILTFLGNIAFIFILLIIPYFAIYAQNASNSPSYYKDVVSPLIAIQSCFAPIFEIPKALDYTMARVLSGGTEITDWALKKTGLTTDDDLFRRWSARENVDTAKAIYDRAHPLDKDIEVFGSISLIFVLSIFAFRRSTRMESQKRILMNLKDSKNQYYLKSILASYLKLSSIFLISIIYCIIQSSKIAATFSVLISIIIVGFIPGVIFSIRIPKKIFNQNRK